MPKTPWVQNPTPVTQPSPFKLHHGVVSPCSTCTNKRSETQDGKPFCPRLYWARIASGQDVQEHLLLTGTKTEALANPVTDESSGTHLVWVAALENNQPLLNSQGKVTEGSILDLDFNTDRIQCELEPYVIGTSEASAHHTGAYREKQHLLLNTVRSFQHSTSGQPIPYAGIATRITFIKHHMFKTPKQEVIVSGT